MEKFSQTMLRPMHHPKPDLRAMLFELVVLALILSGSFAAHAGTFTTDTSVRLLYTHASNPDVPFVYSNRTDTFYAAVLRLINKIDFNENIQLESNIATDMDYTTQLPADPAFTTGGNVTGDYRYPDLKWEWESGEHGAYKRYGTTAMDRFVLRMEWEHIGLAAGRQPVNLGTCFYFTPNDFFQPFAAQSFNRIYKPGVDAFVVSYYTGNLAELRVIGVGGYSGRNMTWQDSAVLSQLTMPLKGYEISAIGGKVAGRYVVGAALEGEIGTFGVRAEMNGSFPEQSAQKNYFQLSGGVDRRWPGSFHLFMEYMYHGNGSSRAEDYFQTLNRSDPYVGVHYLALAGTFEAHPLVNIQAALITNLNDPSTLAVGTVKISLSDETDCVLGFEKPFGKTPVIRTQNSAFPELEPRSEYGMVPASVFIELRSFF